LKPVVLQLIDSFQQGGSERQALQLTQLLQESGRFNLRLACLSPEGPLRKDIEHLDLGEPAGYPLKSFYDLNALRQLRRFTRYLRMSKVDILHTHDFYTNIFGMFAGALARVPVRIASRRETSGMRSATQHKVQSAVFKLAHQVIANSEAVREQLIAEGVRADKITVIYNGVEIDRVGPASRLAKESLLAALNLPTELGNRSLVTIVANMRLPVKDHSMFLRAARRVKEAIPRAAFLLAGEGELMPSIRAEAESLRLGADVFFLGACDKLGELLAVSDVCVLSSKAEGFSNSILEYMAAARPVVATEVGGAREAIVHGETGYLVRSGNDAAMGERIVSLLRDPEKARAMGAEGCRIVRQKFSREAQLENTEKLYDKLLNERRGESVIGGAGTIHEGA
jgi:glycosyltransferase involved in cell wall biosynthesis